MVVIGGLASIPGAILGAFAVRGVTWWLPADWQFLVTGAGLLVVLLVFRGGLGAALADLRDGWLRRVARRRGVAAPALLGIEGRAPAPSPRDPVAPTPSPTATMLLSVRGLDVEIDGASVLAGIDLDVAAGEIVALVGTNGSGKSTLLRVVSGVLRPEHGRVRFAGDDITRTRPERLVARGMVQSPGGHGVFPSLTVTENLRLAAWTVTTGRTAAIEHALERFPELRELSPDRAGDLSGGEQQLLTFAMALVTRPRLLLVDELGLGLAPAALTRVRTLLEELRAEGATIVVVDQSLDTALALADRACYSRARCRALRGLRGGPARATRSRTRGVPRHRTPRLPHLRPPGPPAARACRHRVGGRRRLGALRRCRRARRREHRGAPRRDRRARGAERRGEDHVVRRGVGVPPDRPRPHRPRRRRRAATSPVSGRRRAHARASAARSRTAACSPPSPCARR